jgi:hypothetical protein
MGNFLRRAKAALTGLLTALDLFENVRSRLAHAGQIGAKPLARLVQAGARVRAAANRLQHSLIQIETTGLDIVDLQVRMEGEGAALAAALGAIGDELEALGGLAWESSHYDLDEAAERVAAALFPNAIDGVGEINRTLWLVRPMDLEYGRVLAKEVPRRRLTADQLARVEATAATIRARFDAVNDLLNELVVAGTGDPAAVRALERDARSSLRDAIREARSKAAEVYKPFHGVLKQAEGLARKIDEQFAGLRVPVFPPADELEELRPLVDGAVYVDLAGVERFALLNIAARLRSIATGPAAGDHLLAPRFAIRIFDVFPDRVYLTADATFIQTVEGLVQSRVFEPAPASLHRFNTGSFKQRQSGRGNLQVSYTFGTTERPDDRSKVRVDADIDLYRSPLRHLFGEVLVNHLTGSKTDQFKVFDILAEHRVRPIGDFEVVSV